MKFLSCNSVLLAALYCVVSVTTTAAFTQPMMNINNNMPHCAAARSSAVVKLQSHDSDSDSDSASSMPSPTSRARFLSTFAAAVVSTAVGVVSVSALPAAAAAAADAKIDPSVKGTKKDPGYESCVSQCMYECTKPKGNEQMSRTQCLPGCKKQCATTKAQLMVGTPLPDTTNAKK
jgi:hypothetical protein